MEGNLTAGIDWAGDGWLAVVFEDGNYSESLHEEKLLEILTAVDPHQVLIDIPIGLPEDTASLSPRESLDSRARTFTGRPSSVFPVPSRAAARKAYNGGSYSVVDSQNRLDLQKGLSQPSYYIADTIGEVDVVLEETAEWRQRLIESHPEVCFRGLLGRELTHAKHCGPGVGERVQALTTVRNSPGQLLASVSTDLIEASDEISFDDVLDATVLGVVSTYPREQLQFIPSTWETDPRELPLRMAFKEVKSGG